MHELPVTKSICDIVLRHAANNEVTRVLSVSLQRYFDRLSRGTVAEKARLDVDRVPAVFRCKSCQGSLEVHSLIDDDLVCGLCGSGELVLTSDRKYMVKRIEVI